MIFRNEINIPHGKLHRGDKCFIGKDSGIYLGSYRSKDKDRKEPWVHLIKILNDELPIILEVVHVADISLDVMDE